MCGLGSGVGNVVEALQHALPERSGVLVERQAGKVPRHDLGRHQARQHVKRAPREQPRQNDRVLHIKRRIGLRVPEELGKVAVAVCHMRTRLPPAPAANAANTALRSIRA